MNIKKKVIWLRRQTDWGLLTCCLSLLLLVSYARFCKCIFALYTLLLDWLAVICVLHILWLGWYSSLLFLWLGWYSSLLFLLIGLFSRWLGFLGLRSSNILSMILIFLLIFFLFLVFRDYLWLHFEYLAEILQVFGLLQFCRESLEFIQEFMWSYFDFDAALPVFFQ